MKLFDMDSPLMVGLSKMADLLWLNVLTLICCLPIVTIGPALTAMNYMALKLVRNEECYITRGFFKSFKENLRQGIVIWLILLVAIVVLVSDFIILSSSEMQYVVLFLTLICVVLFFVACTMLYVFPVLAKFQNTIKATMKNAVLISILQFPKTIVMIVLYLIPVVIFFYGFALIPFVFFFGLSAPAYASAKMYNKFFKKLEDQYWEGVEASSEKEEENGDETDERIFRDELDNTLKDKSV